jgi:hypothetical protein
MDILGDGSLNFLFAGRSNLTVAPEVGDAAFDRIAHEAPYYKSADPLITMLTESLLLQNAFFGNKVGDPPAAVLMSRYDDAIEPHSAYFTGRSVHGMKLIKQLVHPDIFERICRLGGTTPASFFKQLCELYPADAHRSRLVAAFEGGQYPPQGTSFIDMVRSTLTVYYDALVPNPAYESEGVRLIHTVFQRRFPKYFFNDVLWAQMFLDSEQRTKDNLLAKLKEKLICAVFEEQWKERESLFAPPRSAQRQPAQQAPAVASTTTMTTTTVATASARPGAKPAASVAVQADAKPAKERNVPFKQLSQAEKKQRILQNLARDKYLREFDEMRRSGDITDAEIAAATAPQGFPSA